MRDGLLYVLRSLGALEHWDTVQDPRYTRLHPDREVQSKVPGSIFNGQLIRSLYLFLRRLLR